MSPLREQAVQAALTIVSDSERKAHAAKRIDDISILNSAAMTVFLYPGTGNENAIKALREGLLKLREDGVL